MSDPRAITINEALEWLKTLDGRHSELVNLRNQNSAEVTRHYGVGGDKTETRKPTYDVKQLDGLITRLATEVRKLRQQIKATNATATVVGYLMDEAILGQVE